MTTRKQTMVLTGAAVIAAAGVGTGAIIAAAHSPGHPVAAASTTGYSWYRSMMSGRFGTGTMMGGSGYGWMMSQTGYRWMTGSGADSPGWMAGGALPGAMMGGGADPGKVMGGLFASSPGPRVSASMATALGDEVPAGARVSTAGNSITFSTTSVRLAILSGGPDETFRAAGLVDPRIVVPDGATVSIQLINAAPDTAHGLVITAGDPASSWMPMMTARPAFTGSVVWFLGNPTTAGMHEGTLTFTASTPGVYRYLCPVPGHALDGMSGDFIVR